MVAPTYEEFTEGKAPDAVYDVTVPKPPGTVEGNLLIAVHVSDGSETHTAPGWTEIDQHKARTGDLRATISLWRKIAGASEPDNYIFSSGTTEEHYAFIMRFTGHHPTTPIHKWVVGDNESNSPECPTLITEKNDCLILRIFGADDDDLLGENQGYPTNHICITVDESGAGQGTCCGGAAYKSQASVGPIGTANFTLAAIEEWAAYTVAIAPEVVFFSVYLESKEDNEATSNLGTITFDIVEYALPDDVSKEVGDYQAEYGPATGYEFDGWETSGGVTVANSTQNPTTVTVDGDGTLRGVYSEEVAPPSPFEETIVAKTFPMRYLQKPPHAKQLTSLVQGATVVETAKNFPLILIKRGSAGELESYWIPISLEVEIDVMVSVPDSFVGTHIAAVLPDGVDTKLRLEIPIPEDFKTLTKAELLLVPGGTGNLRRSVATNFGKIGVENYDQHVDSIVASEAAVTQNKIEAIDVSEALTGVAAEDIVGFEFTREGSHANDTVNAPCYVIGFRLSYQK